MFEKAFCVADGGLWIAGAEKASKDHSTPDRTSENLGFFTCKMSPSVSGRTEELVPIMSQQPTESEDTNMYGQTFFGPKRQTTPTKLPLGNPFVKLPTSKRCQFNTAGQEKAKGAKGRGAGSVIVHSDIKWITWKLYANHYVNVAYVVFYLTAWTFLITTVFWGVN